MIAATGLEHGMLVVEGLTCRFGKKAAVDNASFSVAPGSFVGVIGRSGRQLKQFSGAHQLACASDNVVYAAETSNWRVQKLIIH